MVLVGLSKAFEYKTMPFNRLPLQSKLERKKKLLGLLCIAHRPRQSHACRLHSELSWTIKISGVLFFPFGFSRPDFSSVDLAGICLPSAEIKGMHHHNMATSPYILLSIPRNPGNTTDVPALQSFPTTKTRKPLGNVP